MSPTPTSPEWLRFLFRPVLVARVFFVLLTSWAGMLLADKGSLVEFLGVTFNQQLFYALIGFLAAVVIIIVEYATDAISSHKILMAAMGATAGLVFASLAYPIIPASVASPHTARMICSLMFGYFGIVLAIKHAERFHLSRLQFLLSPSAEAPKVLDSSVIIDGRIRELIELQVIKGAVLVPTFVLNEIQAIADSNDPNRKARGRRGLEILESLREICRTLELADKDYPDLTEVDNKLVQFCREMQADLITNDYNLQKIAQLHKITVININEIANALRPTVYIGENFLLTVVREGKEPGQGVGYLEDGTMVVVDEAVNFLGQEIEVSVSSILQTSSGRLVFARPREETRRLRA
ncbi:MAG TPA: PIN domain nuclease [Candidatus Sumerlaeota bacterium]|nr:PIN domain nuclease [Candidatus Sumerlaeota bacterium]HOR28298.1 PIN domain nuclease [Candidatus Sumerlaeota bacterium]HPK02045.1 PIN domain nuclease [Candidatus Sumerlaeota bacterium]